MSHNKQKLLSKILLLNLIVGVHNIINFSLHGYITALIIGILNIGSWVMLRNLKIISFIIKNNKN
mgnify:CR=1 FL=1